MSYLSGINATTPSGTSTSGNNGQSVPSYAQTGSTQTPQSNNNNTGGEPSYLPDGASKAQGNTNPAPTQPVFGSEQADEAPVQNEEQRFFKRPQMLNEPGKQGANPHSISNSGKKRALVVGINYTMTPNAKLAGCINDANRIAGFVKEHFDFRDIRIMTDDTPLDSRDHPTKENLMNAMYWLVDGAKSGDSFFFHFSGHGAQSEDPTHLEEDGLNETILPADFRQEGMIIDDELFDTLARPLPEGCRFTAIFDSCHSGTALDLPYMYRIREGEFANAHKADEDRFAARHKAMVEKDDLKSIKGLGKMLVEQVGSEVSHQAKKHARRAIMESRNTTEAVVVMLSGCRDDQTSADTTLGNQATGAMSYSFIETMKGNTGSITYKELLHGMREVLHTKGPKEFAQFPQLSYGRPMDLEETFTM